MAIEKIERLNSAMKKAGYTGTKVCNFKQCAKCGGICCKRNACSYVPEDIHGGVSKETIMEMLDRNVAMIYGTMVRVGFKRYAPQLYLSAPEKNNNNGVRIGIMHSPCDLLTKTGCKLAEEERPSQGLALIPNADGSTCECYIDFFEEVIMGWDEYQDILNEIVLERTGRTAQDLMDEELYAEVYDPFAGQQKLSLPMYLKQKLQYCYLYTGGSITVWEHTAISMLLEHHFFADHKGMELEESLRIMADYITVKKV